MNNLYIKILFSTLFTQKHICKTTLSAQRLSYEIIYYLFISLINQSINQFLKNGLLLFSLKFLYLFLYFYFFK
jgi:hypothetical protein